MPDASRSYQPRFPFCESPAGGVAIPAISLDLELVVEDASLANVESSAREILATQLADVPSLLDRLIRGELPVC